MDIFYGACWFGIYVSIDKKQSNLGYMIIYCVYVGIVVSQAVFSISVTVTD